ncbi:type II secretion system F family protein [Paraburkholderia dinghuensis]|uniref:Type II secretion system F family protein n=1 Tax=Paraburkholderia dinghuensis TaxID=2305225 RepID=A0A3N6Q7A8_9BURK|nr:type II secretion system F family protein [Paraburkholderia dinghuensis]RQH08386.1 type II secretion system F family protein [Paraburkholderia dinghuensis]
MSSIFYASIILVFVAVVMAIEGAWEFWNSRHGPAARRLESRIRSVSAANGAPRESVSMLKRGAHENASPLRRKLAKLALVQTVTRQLQQAGLTWSVGQLLGFCAVIPLVVVAVGSLSPVRFDYVILAAALSAMLPVLYMRRRRGKRLYQFERQLPDACDMLARSLRAGHAFAAAIQMVGDEFPEPMGGEFRVTFDEINYGLSLNDALTNLAQRVPIHDLRYFVIAVLIQRETGGNLAELLDSITALVRERFKLFDKVRVLSAEGRMSAWVLILLPFVTAGLMLMINPGFLDVLWEDPAGLRVVQTAALLMVLGVFWIRRTIAIRV